MVSISFRRCLFFLGFLLIGTPIFGFHGLFLPSYGARQAGMGGAFLAIGGSVMDLQNNPAGLIRLQKPQFEAGMAINKANIEYNDKSYYPRDGFYFENSDKFHPMSPLPYLGFASPFKDRFAFGFAVYGQGGGGADVNGIYRRASAESFYDNQVDSKAMVQEKLKFRFMHAKLTAGGAMSLGKLKVGLAIDVSYGFNTIDRTLSVVADPNGTSHAYSFLRAPGGFHYRSDPAVTLAGKFGFIYDWSDHWSTSYSYTLPSYLPMNGKMQTDSTQLDQLGSSMVRRTMPWPERHSLGAAYKIGSFMAALDLHYIPWSKYFSRMAFSMDRFMVSAPIGVQSSALVWNLRWNDQTIVALGFEYKPNKIAYRIGGSYGATPIPPDGLTPFIGSTTEAHASIGFGFDVGNATFDIAFEHAPGKRIKGSPLADWAISREVNGAVFQFDRSTSTNGVYLGLTYRLD